MAVKFNPLEGGRTVKAEILVFVLPVVIIGLLVLAGVIFKFTGSAFEEQLESSSLKTTAEVADGVSDWFDARMLETQMTANQSGGADRQQRAAPEAHGKNLSRCLRQRELGPL